MAVAPAALATLGNHLRLLPGHIRQKSAGSHILNQGTPGHADHQVRRAFAKTAVAPSIFPSLGCILALVTEIRQGGQVVIHLEDNAASLAAVTSVRSASGHVFFPVEGDGTVAPVPGFYQDLRGVDKHGSVPFLSEEKGFFRQCPKKPLDACFAVALTQRKR